MKVQAGEQQIKEKDESFKSVNFDNVCDMLFDGNTCKKRAFEG